MQSPHNATYPGSAPFTAGCRFLRKSVAVLTLLAAGIAGLQAGELSLTWQDNSDNEDGFEIERCLRGGSFGILSTVGSDVESFVDQSIVPGLEYEYRVRAFNAFGYSGYTNVSVGLMPNTPPVLGELPDISVLKGESALLAEFSFSDEESAAADLVVEAISSDLELLPLEAISVVLSEGRGTVSIEPAHSGIGSAVVTLMLSDGVEIAQQAFEVEILRNFAPTVGSIPAIDVYDSQNVGPIGFTVSDSESDASQLVVVGDSLDESLIATDSISIGGSGANRTVSFATQPGVAGVTTIRLAVSDGVNTTNGALRVNIVKNSLPVLSGLDDLYTIEAAGGLTGLAFSVSDRETASSDLQVTVSSSNALIVASQGLTLKGSGGQRTLDVTPNPGMSGSLEITVSVWDGLHAVEHTFRLQVLAPEQIVKILGFTIEESLAVVEVENRPNATFTLWKIHSIAGAWQPVEAVEVVVGSESTTLVDLTPIDAAVCYRVIASE